MVEIVKSMGWTYVSIIYEESNYGIKVSFYSIRKLSCVRFALRRNENFQLASYRLVFLGKCRKCLKVKRCAHLQQISLLVDIQDYFES